MNKQCISLFALVFIVSLQADTDYVKLRKKVYSRLRQGDASAAEWWRGHNEDPMYGKESKTQYEAVYEYKEVVDPVTGQKKKDVDGNVFKEKVKVGERKSGSKTIHFKEKDGKKEIRASVRDHARRLAEKLGIRDELKQQKIDAGEWQKIYGKIVAFVGYAVAITAIDYYVRTPSYSADVLTWKIIAAFGAGAGCLGGLGYFAGADQVYKGRRYFERLDSRIDRNNNARSKLDQFDRGQYHDELFDVAAVA